MNIDNKNTQSFFALVKAGLWERDLDFSPYDDVDFSQIKRLAREQSMVGIISAGINHINFNQIPKKIVLQLIGETMQIEHRNKAMNAFVINLAKQLKEEGIIFVLIKGQGIAQCYEKPLLRTSGDIDLLMDAENYEKAKLFLSHINPVHSEAHFDKHFSTEIEGWIVELHGSMKGMMTCRADMLIDEVLRDSFENSRFRYWCSGGAEIPLPCADNDVLFVFIHFLKHFFHGGVGLRQVCDWCRLLYTFHSELNNDLLGIRLKEMGLMSEWRAFGALAVDWLGMPIESMPLYSPDICWKRKAYRILQSVLDTGNFGHNRDYSYMQKYPIIIRLWSFFWHHTFDSARHFFIFPLDSVRIWFRILFEGLKYIFKIVIRPL